MTITVISTGAWNTAAAGNPTTPTPGTYVAGDILIYGTREFIGSDTISTPGGWSLLSTQSSATQQNIFGLVSVGGDTIPSVTWAGQNNQSIIMAIRGASLTVNVAGDRKSSQSTSIIGPAGTLTPTVDGCIGIFFGGKNKTGTSDSTTFTAPSGWTKASQLIQGGIQSACCLCYQIQTTKTAVSANQVISGSVADSSGQSFESAMIFLEPASSIYVPTPPIAKGGMNVQVCM